MKSSRFALRAAAGLSAIVSLSAAASGAGQIGVQIHDKDGAPVPEVAVFVRPLGEPAPATPPSAPRTMNQYDEAFDPHILIVETGTAVEFPNNDNQRHHVYSFSSIKRFDFSLDSGDVHESLVFDDAGIVTLGCNVHDGMLAYILVVDTPLYAKTDGDGVVALSGLSPGQYEVNVWSPRLPSKRIPEPRIVTVEADNATLADYRLEKLYPPHNHSETSLLWRNAY